MKKNQFNRTKDYPFQVQRAQPHYAVAYTSAKKKKKKTVDVNRIRKANRGQTSTNSKRKKIIQKTRVVEIVTLSTTENPDRKLNVLRQKRYRTLARLT